MRSKKVTSGLLIVASVLSAAVFFNLVRGKRPPEVTGNGQRLSTGRKEDAASFSRDLQRQEEYWKHVHLANGYLKSGRYTLAEEEFQNAIGKARSAGDAWMARSLLREVYEKSGKYDLALKEIEWLHENNTRQDVRKKLSEDKQRLTELTKQRATGSVR